MSVPLIVAIDDENMNIELIGFIIKSMGFDFYGIQDSSQAYELLVKQPPDLILLDVQMPNLNGFELCEKIKLHQELEKIPIIFLTGMGKIQDKIKGLELGGVDYVTKPFNKQELKARINTHIKLLRAQLKVQEQAKKLEDDVKLKNRLFSIIGHDLRSPLSAIKMQLDFILRGIIDPRGETFIDNTVYKLSDTTDEAFNLLSNLLNWAKSESGVLTSIEERINVKQIIDQNIRLIQMALNMKHIRIVTEIPEEAFIYADLNMFKTILRNLLSNALKFTPKKGNIRIQAAKTEGKWVISITDSGTGMSEEDLLKMMDTRQHFSKVGTEDEAGTGLGLVLCQDFIAKNSGKLTIESTLGEGSCFSFDMPAIA